MLDFLKKLLGFARVNQADRPGSIESYIKAHPKCLVVTGDEKTGYRVSISKPGQAPLHLCIQYPGIFSQLNDEAGEVGLTIDSTSLFNEYLLRRDTVEKALEMLDRKGYFVIADSDNVVPFRRKA